MFINILSVEGIPVKYALKELVREFRHNNCYCDRIKAANL